MRRTDYRREKVKKVRRRSRTFFRLTDWTATDIKFFLHNWQLLYGGARVQLLQTIFLNFAKFLKIRQIKKNIFPENRLLRTNGAQF